MVSSFGNPVACSDPICTHKRTEWKKWSECSSDEKKIIILKIALAAILIAGLAAATAFTGLGAFALIGALTVATSTAGFATAGAVAGAALGLGAATFVTPVVAYHYHMHAYNKEKNIKETAKFIASSIGLSALSTGVCAGIGAGILAGVGVATKATFEFAQGIHVPKPDIPTASFDISSNTIPHRLP